MTITSETELVDAIRSAQAPLSLRGGNTRGMAGPGADLSLAGLRGISLYEPGALTLVAQAGTPVSEIETTLAAEGQRLAFEPMDHRALMGCSGTPTIGGVFAANVSGPRRLAIGAARDFLLGVRFVDGQGNVIKNGGRVMKNVTGYDLVKLMAGSRGTLGALTEVSLKVLPTPETSATLVLSGLDDPAAIAAMAQAMRSPFEVTAAAHDPAQRRTYLRLEGFETSVTYRIGRLKDLLSATGAALESLAANPSATLWRDLRDVAAFHGAAGDIWRVHCRPTEAPALAAKAGAEANLYDWAGGLIWLRMAPGTDLRARLGRYDGHATLLRADDAAQALPWQEPEAPGVARLTAGLRAKFDPRGIFNAEALALAP
ncbi:FAD-binding protein [Sulfitobacter dubius]|uniref:FAD-binding protein n=1 Tax=Sulfitobacter dubius TaxID=218673 RepID=UPI0008DF3CCB|nr:FAD-binding protein [Sulfitobacter dubius]SFG97675.1 glycolate oxidase FAD binding subunit [Sulfitobacter dubius]